VIPVHHADVAAAAIQACRSTTHGKLQHLMPSPAAEKSYHYVTLGTGKKPILLNSFDNVEK